MTQEQIPLELHESPETYSKNYILARAQGLPIS